MRTAPEGTIRGADEGRDRVAADQRAEAGLVECDADVGPVFGVTRRPGAELPCRVVEPEIERDVGGVGDLTGGVFDVPVERGVAAQKGDADRASHEPTLQVE